MEPVYIAFGLFLIVTAYNYLKPKEERKYVSLNVDEAYNLIKTNSNLMLIDIRENEEFKSEHVKGARNIPFEKIDNWIGKLPKDRPILIYCQNGAKSIRAIRKFEVSGYNNLYHMHQGLRGWKKKKPTVKSQ
jgi:rhodanese-related sulfurtransferase